MIETMTKAEALRNDLDNLHFSRRYYIGVLAELEQLGKTHTQDFKRVQKAVNTLSANIRRYEEELEKTEEEDLEPEDPYYFSDGMHW